MWLKIDCNVAEMYTEYSLDMAEMFETVLGSTLDAKHVCLHGHIHGCQY